MQVDYIIVGLGLAGLAFSERLSEANKTFVLFEDGSQNSSRVAAGVYNPVILKRFTPVWDAIDQLNIAIPFYKKLEEKLQVKIDRAIDIYRPFNSVEEQNAWFSACDKPFFKEFMIPKIEMNINSFINAPLGYGRITNTGLIDTERLLRSYRESLTEKGKYREERFDYAALQFEEDKVYYKDINASRVVFCEGFGVKKNPFFKDVPLNEAKGEQLVIKAPSLKLKVHIKAGVFILPLGDDLYKVGATFNWTDKTNNPTEEARKELIEKFEKICSVPYAIEDQLAGIRPTVTGRRPLLGKHQKYNQLAILNGLGTRGVMLAPKMSKLLFDHLENGQELPAEVNLARFGTSS